MNTKRCIVIIAAFYLFAIDALAQDRISEREKLQGQIIALAILCNQKKEGACSLLQKVITIVEQTQGQLNFSENETVDLCEALDSQLATNDKQNCPTIELDGLALKS